jgi:putative resolvase
MDSKKLLKVSEVAKELELGHLALLSWIRQGKIKAIKTLGGQYRIHVDELTRIKEEMGYGSTK